MLAPVHTQLRANWTERSMNNWKLEGPGEIPQATMHPMAGRVQKEYDTPTSKVLAEDLDTSGLFAIVAGKCW